MAEVYRATPRLDARIAVKSEWCHMSLEWAEEVIRDHWTIGVSSATIPPPLPLQATARRQGLKQPHDQTLIATWGSRTNAVVRALQTVNTRTAASYT